jgi:hypothetical protein
VKLRDIFNAPTVAEMSRWLERKEMGKSVSEPATA